MATPSHAAGTGTTEYRAPTVGLEEHVFTIGKTKDSAKFEITKEELGKHFATLSWSDGADASMAFETLTEPVYDEPPEPTIPVRFSNSMKADDTELYVEDPEYEIKSLR